MIELTPWELQSILNVLKELRDSPDAVYDLSTDIDELIEMLELTLQRAK